MIRVRITSQEIPKRFPDALGSSTQEPRRYLELSVFLGIQGLADFYSSLFLTYVSRRLGKLLYPIGAVILIALIGLLIAYMTPGPFFPSYSQNNHVERPMLRLIASILIIYALWQFIRGRRLARVHLHVLRPGQPFPVLNPSLIPSNTQVLAVRVLQPNVRERLDGYLNEKRRRRLLTPSRPPNMALPLGNPELSMRRISQTGVLSPADVQLGADFWPVVRLAVDRMLFEPLYQTGKYDTDSEPLSEEVVRDIAHRAGARRLYFAYKLLIPQLCVLVILVASALGFAALGQELGQGTQYPMALAGAGVLWAFFSVWLYRRQHRELLEWAASWTTKPLGSCPIFSYQRENDPRYAWEELTQLDFRVRITEFGVDVEKMFNLVFTVLLVAYLGFLEVIK